LLPPEGTDKLTFDFSGTTKKPFECLGLNITVSLRNTSGAPESMAQLASITKFFIDNSFLHLQIKKKAWLDIPTNRIPIETNMTTGIHYYPTTLPSSHEKGKQEGIFIRNIKDVLITITCILPVCYKPKELDGTIWVGVNLIGKSLEEREKE
jgi:hypothetical protein